MKKNNLSKTERMKTQSDMSMNYKSHLPYYRQSANGGLEKKSFKNELLKKMMEEKKKREEAAKSENPIAESAPVAP